FLLRLCVDHHSPYSCPTRRSSDLILVGRPAVLANRIKRFGLRIQLGVDVEVTDPEHDERFNRYWTAYWEIMCRRGVTREMARVRSEEHTSELQSRFELVCRLPLEK